MLVPSADDHRAVVEAIVPMLEAVGRRPTTRVVETATPGPTFHGRQEGNGFPSMRSPFADPTADRYQLNLPVCTG
jgi:peptide/nickel transport system substrate-binding protein